MTLTPKTPPPFASKREEKRNVTNTKKQPRTNHTIHEARLEVKPGKFLFGTIGGLVFVDLKGREFVLTSPQDVKDRVVVR